MSTSITCSGRPEIIKMDYGMTDGSIRMRVRAAVEGYMLLRWNVDCSPDHSLTEEQYRLWRSDPLALYGVENANNDLALLND